MTDGIIHNILRPYIESSYLAYEECKNQDPDSIYTENARRSYEQKLEIQNKIIGKIKQEFNDQGYLSHNTETLKKLIGDNQE